MRIGNGAGRATFKVIDEKVFIEIPLHISLDGEEKFDIYKQQK